MKTASHAKPLPSIVILHGWGLSGERFLPLVGALKAQGYRVYAPDLPGFGMSPRLPRPYTLTDYAAFLGRYLTDNAITHPIVIGHSFGGRVALKYADTAPGSIAGLILTGTPGYSSIRPVKYALSVAIAKLGNAIFGIGPLVRLRDRVRREYYRAVGAKDFYRAEGELRQTFKNVVREDLTPYMQRLSIPCLLLWGREDALVPLAVAKRMQTAIPNAELVVVEGKGHDLPVMHTASAVPHIVQFITRLCR